MAATVKKTSKGKGRQTKVKKAVKPPRVAPAVESASTDVLVQHKAHIVRSFLSRST